MKATRIDDVILTHPSYVIRIMLPHSSTSNALAQPFLLTVRLYPSLPSSAVDPGNSSNQIIAVSSSQNDPHKFLVQHYHLPRSSVRSPYNAYQIDLDGSTEYSNSPGIVTAIELTVTNRAALSPCLLFGTATGSLYLTRSGMSRHVLKARDSR